MMDEILKLKIFTVLGSIIGTMGVILLVIGGGYGRYTGWTEGMNPVYSSIGLVLIVTGGVLLGYRIKKKK
jgi:drug/metabolite transporter (DMT)-like permease